MNKTFTMSKYFIIGFVLLTLIAFSYLFYNRHNYEQSEAKITLQAISIAEKNYYTQNLKFAHSLEELRLDFSKLANTTIYFNKNSLPANIKLFMDEQPYVNNDSYRIIVLFKTSNEKLHLWRLENENIKFIRSL